MPRVPGSDIKLILARNPPAWSPAGHQSPRAKASAHRGGGALAALALAGAGPGSPRPVRPIDSAAPVWTLERWDSQPLIFGESAASDADGRGAGQTLALAVRAVLTFQHRAVPDPGPWTTFP
jgi:hypothetical protein